MVLILFIIMWVGVMGSGIAAIVPNNGRQKISKFRVVYSRNSQKFGVFVPDNKYLTFLSVLLGSFF